VALLTAVIFVLAGAWNWLTDPETPKVLLLHLCPFPTYLLLLHPFNGIFSRTTLVSRCQRGKTSLDVNEATHDGVWGWQWHQLDHMQTICTSLQTDNHTNTSSLNFYRPDALFLMPIQHCQSTEGIFTYLHTHTRLTALFPGLPG